MSSCVVNLLSAVVADYLLICLCICWIKLVSGWSVCSLGQLVWGPAWLELCEQASLLPWPAGSPLCGTASVCFC